MAKSSVDSTVSTAMIDEDVTEIIRELMFHPSDRLVVAIPLYSLSPIHGQS